MTDDETRPTNDGEQVPNGEGTRSADETDGEDRDVRDLLLRGALLVLGLVAVVALVQFYASALAVIDEWIAREYRALFRAAFNLVVLLAAGVGISLVVRELTGDDRAA